MFYEQHFGRVSWGWQRNRGVGLVSLSGDGDRPDMGIGVMPGGGHTWTHGNTFFTSLLSGFLDLQPARNAQLVPLSLTRLSFCTFDVVLGLSFVALSPGYLSRIGGGPNGWLPM